MPKVADPARQLADTIARLQQRRRALVAELSQIDALCAKFGIQLQERKGPGRPPGRPKAGVAEPARGRRPRGRFVKSANVAIVDFLKSKGAKGATTAEINNYWQSEGRAGSAYVAIGHLVKQRKIKRENLKGQRGSRYTAS
jgi:hypothetical protein